VFPSEYLGQNLKVSPYAWYLFDINNTFILYSCYIINFKFKSLDEVHVSMGTCSELRQPSANLKPPTYAAGWKYGFSDKVVDGVTLSVNSLIINFKSPAFEASLQVSHRPSITFRLLHIT
jgi:hypothetical protein